MATPRKRSPWTLGHPDAFPSIPQYFSEKSVLVIGAFGFLGKVLIEKLLRSCPELETIFVLMIPTETKRQADAFREFIESNVFDRLRKDHPGALRKIYSFTGEFTDNELLIRNAVYRRIVENVSFVFHCGFNVQFDDEPLYAMDANLLRLEKILGLCSACLRLQAFVYVSTAFSYCNYSHILEQTYQESLLPQDMLRVLRFMRPEHFRPVYERNVQGRPSVHPYSEAMAENLIIRSDAVPAIIVRSSILTASVNEPFPGWTDNSNAPSGFIAECGKGIVRTLLVKDNVNADLVPVDMVANTLIVASHYMAVKRNSRRLLRHLTMTGKVLMINCTCPSSNKITWRRVIEICLPLLAKYPSMQVHLKPGGTVTACPSQYNLIRMCHYITAALIDGSRYLTFRKPEMIGHYKSIHRVMNSFEFYMTNSFHFHSPNMKLLTLQISPEDKRLFPINQNALDWTEYMENYVLGIRRYLLKESDATLPAARTKLRRINYSWIALKLSTTMFGLFLFLRALKKQGYTFPMQSFSYITSAIAVVPSKIESFLVPY